MPFPLPAPRRALVAPWVAAALVLACGEREPPPVADTTPAPPPPADSAAIGVDAFGWDPGAGPVLLVNDPAGPTATIVFPELADTVSAPPVGLASPPAGTEFELFARGGRVGDARLEAPVATGPVITAFSREDGCLVWPAARLSQPLPSGWTVGLAAGRARAVPLDSADALPPADSARLVATAARLASLVREQPADSAEAFRGLPFTIRAARRFAPTPGVDAIVVEAVRKLNQEALPLQEYTILVAERAAGDSAARYRVVWSERVVEREEAIVTTDVLAALVPESTGRPTLVLRREYPEGAGYALLERTPAGTWRLRWTSAYAGC